MRGRRRRTTAATCCSRFDGAVVAGLDLATHQPRGSREAGWMRGSSPRMTAWCGVLRAPRQRTVDHVDGVLHAVHRDERTEARALLLTEQHLVEHVEPVERDTGPAV